MLAPLVLIGTTRNTVATIVMGITAYLVVLLIVALVLGTIGLEAAVLTGGLG